MRYRKYTDEQIDTIRKYYPDANYEEIFKVFPGFTKKRIKTIASYYGVKSNNPGHREDLTGKKYGRLRVIEFSHIENDRTYWKCKCLCGRERVVQAQLLKNGKTKSCGCLRHEPSRAIKNYCGDQFGLLTAIERLPNYKNKRTYYRCKCACGEEKIISSSSLVSGHTKSCGCISRKPKEFWETITRQPYDIYDDSRKYEVYKHTTPNGKVYVGITKQSTEKRWQSGIGYKSQTLFWRAIEKYGWNNIKHEILEEGLTEEEACKKEQNYIKHYKSTYPSCPGFSS